jgi:glycerol-3-phosphate acyltransferase PlsX
MRLAVDVMGGDKGPEELLHGIRLGLGSDRQLTALIAVGPEAELRCLAQKIGLRDERLQFQQASEVLAMDDKPVQGLRKKKDCSLLRAVELVKEGLADAVISSGNTGGIVAASTIRLRTLEGVTRPTIACILPSKTRAWVLVDGGANPECTPADLVQFAVMGSAYARAMFGRDRPRVGVLSNGSEEAKGTDLTRASVAALRQTELNCMGYCEGYDLFNDGVDVVVCDGFVGNIVLKTAEGLGRTVGAMLKAELKANPLRRLGALLAKGGLTRLRQRMNPDIYGGAPLLGLNGTVVKIHGSANRDALKHALGQCSRLVNNHLNVTIVKDIARVTAATAAPANASASH